MAGNHSLRLVEEATLMHQPFGGARQHLNRYLARLRAAQMQNIELAKIYADMGYADESWARAQNMRVARGRVFSEIGCQISTSHRLLDNDEPVAVATLLPEIAQLLKDGIKLWGTCRPLEYSWLSRTIHYLPCFREFCS